MGRKQVCKRYRSRFHLMRRAREAESVEVWNFGERRDARAVEGVWREPARRKAA